MRKILSILLTTGTFLFILTTFISCGATQVLSNKQNQISFGQSQDEVVNILGIPGNKQFQGKDEAWQYCKTGFTSDSFVVVWFYDGKVTGLSSYGGYYGEGNCAKFFKTVNWQDAPDRTIEIRNR